jgi:hypothetical protein
MSEITLQVMLDEIKGRGLGAANWVERAKNNEFRTTPEAIESKERSLTVLRAIHENLKRQMDVRPEFVAHGFGGTKKSK